MRVLYLHQYFATPESSSGTRSYEMAKRLVSYGHSVHMITSSAFLPDRMVRAKGWNYQKIDGIDVDILNLPYSNHMGFLSRLRCFIQFCIAATMHALKSPCDVVFATSTPLTIAIPAIVVSRRHKVPMVFEVRDLWPEVPIAIGALRSRLSIYMARRLEVAAYRAATRLVALSPGMAEGILLCRDVNRSSVDVIPNSCDLDMFTVDKVEGERFRASYDWLGNRPLGVYAGTIGIINGVEYLVSVAEEMAIRCPDVCFLIVGDGKERLKVEQAAS